MKPDPDRPEAPHAPDAFFDTLRIALEDGSFRTLRLADYRGAVAGLREVTARPVLLRDGARISFLHRYATRDVTRNLPPDKVVAQAGALLTEGFRQAELSTTAQRLALRSTDGHTWTLQHAPPAAGDAAPTGHDRQKKRLLDPHRPFLRELGITDGNGRVLPSMSAKWKQMNKFLEIFAHAVEEARLAGRPEIRVNDFGAGKGYLTFALHDYLVSTLGQKAVVTGVEIRSDLVEFCNRVALESALAGLSFRQGGLDEAVVEPLDVLVALHACDTATDRAIAMGIRGGAAIVLCAPCCHKELRAQLESPPVLRPLLRHGIHAEKEAEMLTDSLRALLLEIAGYEAKVFEFVSLEHTAKNKMILAVRRPRPRPRPELAESLRALKTFYGVRGILLEELLAADATAR